MTMQQTDNSQSLARWAGLIYLILIILGIGGAGVIRGGAVVSGDAVATASNILASQGVFLLSIGADILMLVADVAMAVLFWALFRRVNGTISAMAAAFRLVQASTIAVSLLALWAGTVLVYCDPQAVGAAREQLDMLALALIEMHGVGYDLGLVFFAVSCLLTGYLIVKSGFVPKTLGWLMIASGVVYLTGSTTTLFAPDGAEAVQYFYAITVIAEGGLALWLLFKGVNAERWRHFGRRAIAA